MHKNSFISLFWTSTSRYPEMVTDNDLHFALQTYDFVRCRLGSVSLSFGGISIFFEGAS